MKGLLGFFVGAPGRIRSGPLDLEMPAPVTFDPSSAASPDSGLFGLPHGPEEAACHVIGVPFDATTSYRKGTSGGPEAILAASHQVDLFDALTAKPYEAGIWMAPLEPTVKAWNDEASAAFSAAEPGRVDAIQAQLNDWVEAQAAAALEAGKFVALVGGDHSVPFGSIRAHAERHPGMGILHLDAHADLRAAYGGCTWSHASILHNVTTRIPEVARVLQVGIRDLCEEEQDLIEGSGGRIRTLFDHEWVEARLRGQDLVAVVRRSLACLPQEVYITFDVDGLDPALCPNTGTPVPGGFTWNEAMLWLRELVASGRRIVGVDLTEVAPEHGHEPGQGWDEIVGARLLYRLIGFALLTAHAT